MFEELCVVCGNKLTQVRVGITCQRCVSQRAGVLEAESRALREALDKATTHSSISVNREGLEQFLNKVLLFALLPLRPTPSEFEIAAEVFVAIKHFGLNVFVERQRERILRGENPYKHDYLAAAGLKCS